MARRSTLFLIAVYGILSLITNFPSGFTNSTVNTAVAELHEFINSSYVERGVDLSAGSIALIQSATLNCWFVAQIFGSMFTPFLTDRYGRRRSYQVAVSMTIAATIVQYLSVRFKLPEGLILGRSFTALSSPLGDASLLLYLQETSPLSIRGMASFFCEIGYGSMCLLGMVLGMRSVLGHSLEQLLLLSIIPEILSFFFIFFIPDTPKYLMIMKGNRKQALKSLEFFQGKSEDNEVLLDQYELEKMAESNNEHSSVKEVFTTWHLKQSVYLSCCVLILTLSFYPILQSSTYFFLQSQIPRELAEISSTVLMVVLTCSSVIGANVVDRYPRRILIMISGVLSNFFLLLFSIFSITSHMAPWIKYACLGSIISYCITFGMILGPISWFVAPELVSQRHKSTVFAICFAINNIFISFTDFATIPLFRLIGGISFVPLFIVPACLCLLYLYLYLPETLGKETYEIVTEMRFKKNKSPLQNDSPSMRIRAKYEVFVTSPSAILQ